MKSIRITLRTDELHDIQQGLADAACWMRGYMAGNPNVEQHPIGLEEIRQMNTILKRAEARAEADRKDLGELFGTPAP